MSRTVASAAVVAFVTVVGLLASLIVLIVKLDKTNNVTCKSENDGSRSENQFETTTANVGGDTKDIDEGGLTVPECPTNPDSLKPDLDKAKCILESYPLIDG